MRNIHKEEALKKSLSSTKSVVNKYFNGRDEYLCEELSAFAEKLHMPMPITKQDDVTFIFITDKHINLWLGYEKFVVGKGQLLIIQPQKLFAFEAYHPEVKGYVLQLKGGGVLGSMGNHSLIFNLEFLETWSDSFFEFQKLPLEYIENIFKRLQWEYQHQGDKLFVVNAYVITLLLELNELYNEAVHSNKASIDISRKFKNEVYKNLHLQLPVSEYANRLSITPNHLNKSIKSNTGLTASELINRIKITEAKYLLMRADLNVSAVAEQLGFSDSSYFSRFFKKHESVSPIEFQRMIDLS